MGIYTYKAVDSKGKSVKGEIEADGEADVSTQLAKLGYIPVTIGFKGEKTAPLLEKVFKKTVRKVSVQALIVFTRQFATIIKAAVPMIEGLGVLAEQAEDESLKQVLYSIIHEIEEGYKLSEAMAKHPGAFSSLYVNTVVAGEAGGVLDKVLFKLANVLEDEQETVTSIKTALRYPVMVSIALFLAVFVLSTAVVPNFAKIYSGMGVKLPLPTQIMIIVSNTFMGPWKDSPNILLKFSWYAIIIAVISGFVFFVRFLMNTPLGRLSWDRFKLKMPIFGKTYNKITMLRFASMLNVLYQAGLPILKVLDIVKMTINNVVLEKEIDTIKKEVADGKGVSGGILASKYFPRMVAYMVSIGEKAGALPVMLDALSEYYTMEVRNALKNLTSLIEPLMTAVLGIVVMGMALAIFMPMWNLISVIK